MSDVEQKLQMWINEQIVDDKMLWKGAWGEQLQFFRDSITGLFCYGMDYEDCDGIATVISTHRSKSIILPVYKLHREDIGLTLVARSNFYDWKLSVISEIPINADFRGLFHTTPPIEPEYTGNELASVYFEGFPKKYIFGYQGENRKQFSASIGQEALWTTIFLILRDRGIIEAREWRTKESHRKELDAESARWKARHEALKLKEKTP